MNIKPLSPAMLYMLKNISAGLSPTHGLRGRSANGASTGTFSALHRRGLLIKGALTDAGREAIK